METLPQPISAQPIERDLLAQLLRQARERAGLDVPMAAREWGGSPTRLKRIEAGEEIPDWWQLRSLLAVYDLGFTAFVGAFEERLAALEEEPAPECQRHLNSDPRRQLNSDPPAAWFLSHGSMEGSVID